MKKKEIKNRFEQIIKERKKAVFKADDRATRQYVYLLKNIILTVKENPKKYGFPKDAINQIGNDLITNLKKTSIVIHKPNEVISEIDIINDGHTLNFRQLPFEQQKEIVKIIFDNVYTIKTI
jgi:hypothetical protein